MPLRYTLQHRDFIANLWMGLGFSIGVHSICCSCSKTYHVLPALHEFLVNDLASEVLAGLDVHGLLDNGIRAATEGLARAVLISRTHPNDASKSVPLVKPRQKERDLT